MPEVRILLVDDQPAFRDAPRALLESRGNVGSEASSGEEAQAAVLSFGPDVVLLDVRLGGESGFEVARALTRAWPELAVVLVSVDTHASPEAVRAVGARGFVPKRQLHVVDLGAFLAPPNR